MLAWEKLYNGRQEGASGTASPGSCPHTLLAPRPHLTPPPAPCPVPRSGRTAQPWTGGAPQRWTSAPVGSKVARTQCVSQGVDGQAGTGCAPRCGASAPPRGNEAAHAGGRQGTVSCMDGQPRIAHTCPRTHHPRPHPRPHLRQLPQRSKHLPLSHRICKRAPEEGGQGSRGAGGGGTPLKLWAGGGRACGRQGPAPCGKWHMAMRRPFVWECLGGRLRAHYGLHAQGGWGTPPCTSPTVCPRPATLSSPSPSRRLGNGHPPKQPCLPA